VNYNKGNDYELYRYVDHIIIFSENNIETPGFYNKNLELIKSNKNVLHINFLDLNIINKRNGKIISDLFDKRNQFNFEIFKNQFFNCLHKNVFKNIIKNHLIRINRLCSKENIYKQILPFNSNRKPKNIQIT